MPSTRILFATSTDRAVKAARRMADEFGWMPVYWLATAAARRSIESQFEGVYIHDYLDSVKGVGHPAFFRGATAGVDARFLDAHAAQVLSCLYMLERNDSLAQDMGLKERVEFVHRVTAYWRTALQELFPSVIVFEEEPHQVSDYLLYLLARFMGIRVLMPIRTMPDWGFLLSVGYEDGPLLGRAPAGASQLPDYMERYLNALGGDYADARRLMLWDQPDGLAPVKRLPWLMTSTRKLLRRAGNAGEYLRNFTEFRSDQKEKGKLLQDSELPYRTYVRRKVTTIRRKAANRRVYERLAARPNLEQPYVYFALSYQPEKSTSPCGAEFVHQLLAVRLLANTLPPGWRLLVKEHPSQFLSQYARYGEGFRNEAYYRSILGFPNTSLVPISAQPYQLMDKARAVASVGGSACFEALVRGRRSLLFGDTWYARCPYVRRVRTSEEIQRALAEPEPARPVLDASVHQFLADLAFGLYRAPAGLSDRALFDTQTAEVEYLRCYRDYHLRFLSGSSDTAAPTADAVRAFS